MYVLVRESTQTFGGEQRILDFLGKCVVGQVKGVCEAVVAVVQEPVVSAEQGLGAE